MNKKIKILDKDQLNRKINRIAWEIYEKNSTEKKIILVGIANRGLKLANELATILEKISNINIIIGSVNLEKDNLLNTDIQFDLSEFEFKNQVVILCDDVLNSGMTLMYTIRYFLDFSLSKLATVVLIDRNHNNYPVRADYVGLSLATTLKEYVSVILEGEDKGAYLS
tara:strand:+ start:263 stop:766 length:504 start_codon:yes stop_codon:yes gene_type:complete